MAMMRIRQRRRCFHNAEMILSFALCFLILFVAFGLVENLHLHSLHVAAFHIVVSTSSSSSFQSTRSRRSASNQQHCQTRSVLYAKAVPIKNDPWYPRSQFEVDDDDIFSADKIAIEIEEKAVLLAADLVRHRLQQRNHASVKSSNNTTTTLTSTGNTTSASSSTASTLSLRPMMSTEKRQRIRPLVHNRFKDLACTESGKRSLEQLFLDYDYLTDDMDEILHDDNPLCIQEDDIVRGAIMVLQSLCIFAMQVGVKGSPEQLKRMVAHLDERRDPSLLQRDLLECWDYDSVRRLKFRRQNTAAVQLLAECKWRRTTQGAFDLLIALGAWQVHEDTVLLRSGFPLSFSAEEQAAAEKVATATAAAREEIADPDEILGLRQDLTHLKVYTIDSISTSEIDDGLSLEQVIVDEEDESSNGSMITRKRHRLWVHIADADHWAPRGSDLFEAARKRITSLYLPNNHISMLPSRVSTQVMSLRAGHRHGDALALSLGVMLDEHGAIDASSIIVTPSRIRVTYRLSYDDVDEMLEEGTGNREEWQLGAMLDMATLRRAHRIEMGSSEGLVPNPIPYTSVNVFPENDNSAAEPIGISVKVEMSHNAGMNKTLESRFDKEDENFNSAVTDVAPVSSSNLLVTEAMILACEALPRWKLLMDEKEGEVVCADENNKSDSGDTIMPSSPVPQLPNQLRLPFRTQPKPDFHSRARERRILESLREYNVGNGLCYAWYIRRFLAPVRISETPSPHSGLGLDCYVQWSSPIRRFSDLQVHASVKRYLRRRRLQELLQLQNEQDTVATLPNGIKPSHLGWPDDILLPTDKDNGGCLLQANVNKLTKADLDQDMNFLEGIGLIGAARTIQRQSQQYWLLEYIRRLKYTGNSDNSDSSNNVIFRAIVLGCIDPERQQYAIYVPELGLEHRYVSPIRLDPGIKLNLTVGDVFPRTGLLTFVRVM